MLIINESETRQVHRSELDAVLAAESFRRAPTLGRILEYLCERQMAGEISIKEYEIAVQVMGRSSSFDPQQDGSVRVNLHHLRKKLRRYYETEGSGHAWMITLPIGQSLPTFVSTSVEAEQAESHPDRFQKPSPHDRAEARDEVSATELKPQSSSALPAMSAWKLLRLPLVTILAVLLGAGAVWLLRGRAAPADSALFVDSVLRIACGQTASSRDGSGRLWEKDIDFEGGRAFHRKEAISGASSPDMYLSGREGNFSYGIPLPDGSYELHLYFAETALHGEGFRLMRISVNGQPVEQKFDPTSDAGAFATATEKVYVGVRPAGDGKLHVNFEGVNADAFVNAIEIMPSNGDRMRPVRQTTLARYYFDPFGMVWSPDEWFHGGRTIYLQSAFPHIPLDGFYQHERFGNFDYSIPVVPNRTYSLTLYFQDVWFSQNPEKTIPFERREFDVSCNGKELLHQQDILHEAGHGSFRLTKHFTGLSPSAQGKLVLAFRPSQNYATINAIEVEQEPVAGSVTPLQP